MFWQWFGEDIITFIFSPHCSPSLSLRRDCNTSLRSIVKEQPRSCCPGRRCSPLLVADSAVDAAASPLLVLLPFCFLFSFLFFFIIALAEGDKTWIRFRQQQRESWAEGENIWGGGTPITHKEREREERRGEERRSRSRRGTKNLQVYWAWGGVCVGGGMRTWTTHPRCHCD